MSKSYISKEAKNFKMATAAILIYSKAKQGTARDSLEFDSRHVQVHFLKFSAFYIFFPFDNAKISNTLGLLTHDRYTKKALIHFYI